MSNVFSIAPSNTNTLRFVPGIPFVCGLSWDDCWSSDAVFRVSSDDGSQRGDFTRDQGEEADGLIFFTFGGARPNVRYQGSIVDGDVEYKLFGLVEIARLTDPDDPCTNLPIPDCVCTLPDADDGSPGAGDE